MEIRLQGGYHQAAPRCDTLIPLCLQGEDQGRAALPRGFELGDFSEAHHEPKPKLRGPGLQESARPRKAGQYRTIVLSRLLAHALPFFLYKYRNQRLRRACRICLFYAPLFFFFFCPWLFLAKPACQLLAPETRGPTDVGRGPFVGEMWV
jgi:hypothetical protein